MSLDSLSSGRETNSWQTKTQHSEMLPGEIWLLLGRGHAGTWSRAGRLPLGVSVQQVGLGPGDVRSGQPGMLVSPGRGRGEM